MPIEAIVYDMDGVLVDSEVYWDKSRIEFARDRGLVWTDAYQRLAMGRSTVGWAGVMQEKLALDEPIDEIIAEMKARVIAQYEARMPARPGALESVARMKRHYRVGLASGSPTDIIRAVLRITGLDQLFEVMIYGDEVARGKPAPDIYIEALKQLGRRASGQPRHRRFRQWLARLEGGWHVRGGRPQPRLSSAGRRAGAGACPHHHAGRLQCGAHSPDRARREPLASYPARRLPEVIRVTAQKEAM